MLRSSSGDSCRLWLSQPLKPGDSLTAQLAAKVEAAREQVQQYAQAADVAALTAHYAVTQASQQVRAPLDSCLRRLHVEEGMCGAKQQQT